MAHPLFRTVVTSDGFPLALPFDASVEQAYHALRRQREVDLDPQAFAVEV
jgi:hypothetical protein